MKRVQNLLALAIYGGTGAATGLYAPLWVSLTVIGLCVTLAALDFADWYFKVWAGGGMNRM